MDKNYYDNILSAISSPLLTDSEYASLPEATQDKAAYLSLNNILIARGDLGGATYRLNSYYFAKFGNNLDAPTGNFYNIFIGGTLD